MTPVETFVADRVVSTNAVAVVVTTVKPTDDDVIVEPPEIMVRFCTATEDTVTVVSTGTLTTVVTTIVVCTVVSGTVIVSVVVFHGWVAVALLKGAVILSGIRVEAVMVGRVVGNGCTGGLPPVSNVEMTDPVDTGAPDLVEGVCVSGRFVIVTDWRLRLPSTKVVVADAEYNEVSVDVEIDDDGSAPAAKTPG